MLIKPYVTAEKLPAAAERWLDVLRNYTRPVPRGRFRRSALIVVDMQRFFLDPDSPARLRTALPVLGPVKTLVDSFREAGRPVAFAVYGSARGGPMAKWWKKRCPKKSRFAKLGGGLEARRDEGIFLKSGYSSFRGTKLAKWLGDRKVQEVVVTGVLTHLCVESTVRDAFEEGYTPYVPVDACAAGDERMHLSGLSTMACGFAYLLRSSDVIRKLGKSG